METGEALLLIGGAVALYGYNQYRAGGNLNFFPGPVTDMSFEGMNPVATAQLLIQNTSNVSFTIYSLSGSVTLNGTMIGNISDFTPVTIAGNSEGYIPLKLRLLLLTIVQNLINAFGGGAIKENLQVTGTVNANGIQVPLSITYQISI